MPPSTPSLESSPSSPLSTMTPIGEPVASTVARLSSAPSGQSLTAERGRVGVPETGWGHKAWLARENQGLVWQTSTLGAGTSIRPRYRPRARVMRARVTRAPV